jgi:nitroreductase
MDFLTLSKKRYAVRRFADTPLSDEQIEILLKATQNAPTAHNNQPQKIFVFRSKESLEIVDAATRGRFNAPVVFLVCYDLSQSWKAKDGRDSGAWDASIVATHLLLQATDLGLGSIWVAMFKPEVFKEKLNLNDMIIPLALIPVGYPAFDSVPFEMHDSRKPISDTVTIL